MSAARHVLTLSCANRPGIVAKVSTALVRGRLQHPRGAAVRRHRDRQFLHARRLQRRRASRPTSRRCAPRFADIAAAFGMTWSMRAEDEKKRVALLVSRFDHCLVDLLYRWRSGELTMDVVAIIANYPRETYDHIDFGEIPFHYLPVDQADQDGAGGAGLGDRARRARPTSSCSRATCRSCPTGSPPSCSGRCINIHHSFLPGFKGAKPYHQAHARGVKLIGATAHFVTVRSRRRADHRAGRRAHHPSRHARGPGAQGPRHRAARARARAAPITSRTASCSTAARRWCFPTDAADLALSGSPSAPRAAWPAPWRAAFRAGFFAAAFFAAAFFSAAFLRRGRLSRRLAFGRRLRPASSAALAWRGCARRCGSGHAPRPRRARSRTEPAAM